MAGLWGQKGEVEMLELGDNKFLWEFDSKEDRERVLETGPWNFNGYLMLMDAPQMLVNPSEMELFSASFWIQASGFPFGGMTQRIGVQIGNMVGKCLGVDNQGKWGKFMRIRVQIDVRKPLKKEVILNFGRAGEVKIPIKYEKLDKFCFFCGLLDHTEIQCKLKKEAGEEAANRLDSSLRAENKNFSRRERSFKGRDKSTTSSTFKGEEVGESNVATTEKKGPQIQEEKKEEREERKGKMAAMEEQLTSWRDINVAPLIHKAAGQHQTITATSLQNIFFTTSFTEGFIIKKSFTEGFSESSEMSTGLGLESLVDQSISVITNDGRNIVGTLKGYDQATNIILDDCHERVYSTKEGVEQLWLGLYMIRGDNISVVGEVDDQLDGNLDLSNLRAHPLKPVIH